MNIAMAFFFDDYIKKIAVAKQLGVTHAVVNVNPQMRTLNNDYNFEPFLKRLNDFNEAGIKVDVIEGPTPLEKTKLGRHGRDEEIEVFFKLLHIMAKNNIKTVCYNWMPVVGWFRNLYDIPSRGGALVTGYNHKLSKELDNTEYGVVTADEMWKNLEYFLKAVIPVAEKLGIKLAIHPDDPPVESLRGISRILISFNDLKKATELIPSECNGITLCQGSLVAMGEDPLEAIDYFGKHKKLFFAHFRDIRGDRYDFKETFHDDGPTDMYKCIRKYYDVNFNGCIRPDHVPTMPGEDNTHPGYSLLGNYYAVGYMKGLIEAAKKEVHNG